MAKADSDLPPRDPVEAEARVRKAVEPFAQAIENHGAISEIQLPNARESYEQVTDHLRLNDLVTQHGLNYQRVGSTYSFEDFTAHGLKQALGFAEGFDRARSAKTNN